MYFLGTEGEAHLDLKPAWSTDQIRNKLLSIEENLSPLRRIKKQLQLGEAALALLFHHTKKGDQADLEIMIRKIKAFPLQLLSARPLLEAISSKGGVLLDELMLEPGRELMLKKHPGIFCGGEMLDWDAPTGGFLIQASVTQGAVAARGMLEFIQG
jgi:predicted flavoprotein YhiN